MEIVFGLLVLVLIILGLRNRKKRTKTWLKEERFEESGDWIDKRSGERGTYGSLDQEMDSNRLYIATQSKINGLAQEIQAYCFAQHPAFAGLNDEQLKRHLSFCKSGSGEIFDQIEKLLRDPEAFITPASFPTNDLSNALKKIILSYSYERFPSLLDLEIAQIQRFDHLAQEFANRVLQEIDLLKN